jgi:hypothetical protein
MFHLGKADNHEKQQPRDKFDAEYHLHAALLGEPLPVSLAARPHQFHDLRLWAMRLCGTSPTAGLQDVTWDGGCHHLRGTQPSDAGCQGE